MSLYEYTIAEITQHLEERAFSPDHIIEISPYSWQLEHPLRCRLNQYDEISKTMLTLRQSCAVNYAMENGVADLLSAQRGFGRYVLSPASIEALLQMNPQAETFKVEPKRFWK